MKERNRCADTQHEVLLRRTLWHLGLRFLKYVRTLTGKPDIVFPRARTVVFCDGDFWHGRNWKQLKLKLTAGSNPGYWKQKIASNIHRDRRHTALLRRQGWRVIRVWETDIHKHPLTVAQKIARVVSKRRCDRRA